ncbi:hypothetical protein K8R03_00515 [Candidatus Kaiserbacteria bacterium]|nr:hypothetical protein [Candidatus Kaiserbacteria bacterium]
MIQTIKQLILLITKTDKVWLIPVFLFLIIVVLLVISAQIAPVPLFIYPFL